MSTDMYDDRDFDTTLGRLLLGLCDQGDKKLQTIAAVLIRDPSKISELFGESRDIVYSHPSAFLDPRTVSAVLKLRPRVLSELMNGILAIATSERQFKRAVNRCLEHSLGDLQLSCIAESVYYRGINIKLCIPILPIHAIQRLEDGIDVVLAAKSIIHMNDSGAQVVKMMIRFLSSRGTRSTAMSNAIAEAASNSNLSSILKGKPETAQLVSMLKSKCRSSTSLYLKDRFQRIVTSIEL